MKLTTAPDAALPATGQGGWTPLAAADGLWGAVRSRITRETRAGAADDVRRRTPLLLPDWLRRNDTLLEDEPVVEASRRRSEVRWPQSR